MIVITDAALEVGHLNYIQILAAKTFDFCLLATFYACHSIFNIHSACRVASVTTLRQSKELLGTIAGFLVTAEVDCIFSLD